jgi:cyclophilin family peptidyl-prolyl cis-trans isomerase/dienelactone hydrolase
MSKFIPFILMVVLLVGCGSDLETESGSSADNTTTKGSSPWSSSTSGAAKTRRTPKGERSTKDAPTKGEFNVRFETTKGNFTIKVHRDWAPRGAERLYQLIKNDFFEDAPFYRVMPGFIVQFGMNADPAITKYWDKNLVDDRVKKSNTRGMVTYAMAGPHSRSTQLFINYGNNKGLDRQGFAPFGEVVLGMDVVDSISSEYGQRPDQQEMVSRGNEYVLEEFPNIDFIRKTAFVTDEELAKELGTDESDTAMTEGAADTDGNEEASEKKEDAEAGASDDSTNPIKKSTSVPVDSGTAIAVANEKWLTPVKFASADGLEVTGDLYMAHEDKSTPFIVLCHQAGWSRGEYREIAPKLNELGFNCVAIDQRSGSKVNGVKNETAIAAEKEGKETTCVDAEQDIIAAINWAKENHATGKVILWGSSYSAALAIRIAGENPKLVNGVLSFAPGEYFERFGKPNDWIQTSAEKIKVPVFITSAKKEKPKWSAIYRAIRGGSKSSFVPQTDGNHGSRALFAKFQDSKTYWLNVRGFLSKFVRN